MSLQNVQYGFASAGYLIFAIVPFFLLAWGLYQHRERMLQRFADPKMYSNIVVQRNLLFFWIKTGCFCLAWIFGALALMQPMGYGRYPTELSLSKKTDKIPVTGHRRTPQEVVLYIDTSASMGINDMLSGKTRLDAAKEIADTIISRLTGENISLEAFAADTLQLAPPTNDYLYTRLILRDLKIATTGTLGTDLKKVSESIYAEFSTQSKSIGKAFVILSDGGDTEIESVEGQEKAKKFQQLASILKDASANNAQVFTIGLGTSTGKEVPNTTFEGKPVMSNLDEEILKAISQAGNGIYYDARQYSTLDLAADLVKKFAQSTGEEVHVNALSHNDLIYDQYYQIPLAFAILFLALSLLLPDTRQKVAYA